jgi:glycerol kinase
MKNKFILALDQGQPHHEQLYLTTRFRNCKEILKTIRTDFSKPGWVEHDQMRYESSQISVATEVIATGN